MSQGGAPFGNNNAAKGNEWHLAIKRALARRGEGDYRKGLDKLAEKVVEAAEEGDTKAWQDIADRFDGKPKQQTEITGADGKDLIPESIGIKFIKPKVD